jgi:hypothetical protein
MLPSPERGVDGRTDRCGVPSVVRCAMMPPMSRLAYPLAVLLLLGAAGVWYFVFRPSVEVASATDAQVTIECAPSASLPEAECRAWGDEILAAGAPSNTFEMDDVVRVRMERAPFNGSCRAEYFLGRYPDEVVWTEEVACPGAD